MVGKENILLNVHNLKKYYPIKKGLFSKSTQYVKAVDGISFYIKEGETLGLVGESGCGKSTTGRTILRLEEATSGEIIFEGKNLLELNKKEMRKIRKKMQIIFQDPYSSLNPRMTVAEIIEEPLYTHNLYNNKNERSMKVKELLNDVGLSIEHMHCYPHEFSGGQRQRIGIARALAVNPKFIVADEPVSALDVSIQAQVINLLQDLQIEYKLSYLFIAHNLGVIKHISDRVAIMYLGKIVEVSDKDDLYVNPLHPYTKSLLSAIPIPDPKRRNKNRIILQGDVPSPVNPPGGCRFHPRCQYAKDVCSKVEPECKDYGNGHFAACHLLG